MTEAVAETVGNLARFTLKAGTVVHANGIPAYLIADTEIETNPGNFALMNEPHTVGDPRVQGDTDGNK